MPKILLFFQQNPLLFIHTITIFIVLAVGIIIFFKKKGDVTHVILGRIWVTCMVISCMASFGIRHNGTWNWLHGLAAWTIYCMIAGIYHARKKNIAQHQRYMIGSSIGTAVALVFSLRPNRLLGRWLWDAVASLFQ